MEIILTERASCQREPPTGHHQGCKMEEAASSLQGCSQTFGYGLAFLPSQKLCAFHGTEACSLMNEFLGNPPGIQLSTSFSHLGFLVDLDLPWLWLGK